MKKTLFLAFCFLLILSTSFAQDWKSNKTFTYDKLIEAYVSLDNEYESANLLEVGTTDIGKPLHLLIISENGETDIEKLKQEDKRIVFVNNGIHAGESCGIDASYELAKEILDPNNKLHQLLDRVVLVVIPVYNVGGMLNRGQFSRANQNGPEEHGFRANAQNLDLNRDFIKCDSRNAMILNQVFTAWDPDIFIDTHTTNGSDHQYTLTVISTQRNKQNPIIGRFQHELMVPDLFREMENSKMEITPYIYPTKRDPQYGVKDFLETPRFSSGYATLFNCISFITEAHVFKPYSDRVIQTKAFLKTVIKYVHSNASTIKKIRKEAFEFQKNQDSFPISWELDTTQFVELNFKGFETEIRKSDLTKLEMRFYDRTKPYDKSIKYYNSYRASIEVNKPKYYILPQAYRDVIERLKWNKVNMTTIKNDTQITVSVYYIEDFKTSPKPYEAHYLHSKVQVKKELQTLQFYKGDILIPCNQKNIRYIIETLEPQAVDSYFTWNFFDGVLQQKEWFSDYAFEPKAKQILAENDKLRAEFEAKQKNDSLFRKNNFDQIYFIYKRSKYYEKSAFRYPIYRLD